MANALSVFLAIFRRLPSRKRLRAPASVLGAAWILAHEAAADQPAPELPREQRAQEGRPAPCPPEMVLVAGFCIDRWEASFVDHETSQPLSPYYPPHPGLLRAARSFWQLERFNTGDDSARGLPLPELPDVQRSDHFVGRAVSVPGVVPQAYLSYPLAKRACELAGKRLCTREEWLSACRGAARTPYPYGLRYEPDKCNVYRAFHPAAVLHGNASSGHRDPRLNLLFEVGAGPLLRLTGETATCGSSWGEDAVYDMVGNLDEWVEDDQGTFLGGFYARSTKKGCAAVVTAHGPTYYDYSLGTRCCASVMAEQPSGE